MFGREAQRVLRQIDREFRFVAAHTDRRYMIHFVLRLQRWQQRSRNGQTLQQNVELHDQRLNQATRRFRLRRVRARLLNVRPFLFGRFLRMCRRFGFFILTRQTRRVPCYAQLLQCVRQLDRTSCHHSMQSDRMLRNVNDNGADRQKAVVFVFATARDARVKCLAFADGHFHDSSKNRKTNRSMRKWHFVVMRSIVYC